MNEISFHIWRLYIFFYSILLQIKLYIFLNSILFTFCEVCLQLIRLTSIQNAAFAMRNSLPADSVARVIFVLIELRQNAIYIFR